MADKLVPLNEQERIFDRNGLGTRRFNAYIRQISRRVNETSSELDTSIQVDALSLIADINNRLGSGDALTWDCDSFTWDSDNFTFDMDEA